MLIVIYREKHMGQLRVLLITSQFKLLNVAVLCWKQAVAMKAAILEKAGWFGKVHRYLLQNCLHQSLTEREVV